MKLKLLSVVCLMVVCVTVGDEVVKTVPNLGVGPVHVFCGNAGGWTFEPTVRKLSDGTEELCVKMAAPTPAVPPCFEVTFDVPQLDAHHRWSTATERVTVPPNWGCGASSRLCSGLPMLSFVSDTDENRILVAASEPKRTVGMEAGLREEDCRLTWKFMFFTEPEAPISSYEVKLRFDQRHVFFGDAIRTGMAWIEQTAGLKPAVPPEDAFAPLFSAWYSFHQNVFDREIEAECVEAAKLGMKVLIVDDGWQTDDNNRGYAFTGDWEISKRRFPDMAAHVAKVHALGMKYMIWYGVPMMGLKAKNYERFKGKYLWTQNDRWSGYSCMDPRFPEVRTYICDLYEKAMRDWNLDGLKLDFIDAIGFRGPDPAIKENYAGRDIKSLPEAVDRLLAEIRGRVTAVKPDALIEFRQGYIGPAIRQYGNMMRAADCPGDLLANRTRTANLRLTSGASAVHADMLEWNVAETPENAARYVLATMFSTIQYSVMLRTLPEAHKRMVAHWIAFSQRHRDALLKGGFRPHHFEAFYPWIEAWNDAERIIGVYTAGTVVPADARRQDVYVLNGTGVGTVAVDCVAPCTAELFDTFGAACGTVKLAAGLNAVKLPVSGYLHIASTSPGPMQKGRQLVWSDEFDGTELDRTKWNFRRTMSAKDVVYSNDVRTVRVENGKLHLQVHASGLPDRKWMLSEGVTTHDHMNWKYGYLEMRARVPFRHGAWPSFWMQSTPRFRQVKWLAEVDIFEAFSSTNAVAANIHKWGGGKHTMLKGGEGKGARSFHFPDASMLNDEFHVYGFEWTPEEMSFYVDGAKYYSVPITEAADFDMKQIPGMQGFQDFQFIIFNNEIFTPGHGWCPKPFELTDADPMPIDYEIDWIRLWQDPACEERR